MYILNKKSKGSGNIFVLSCMFVLVICLIASAVFRANVMNAVAQGIQDDLILSSSTVYKYIDPRVLGEDEPMLLITDYSAAYNEVKKYLINNMKLNENMEPSDNGIIKSPIEITDFIIYNYKGESVDIITYNNGAFTVDSKNTLNEDIITKNEHKVNSTVVTTTISMDVKGIYGVVERQSVSVDTDIIIGN